MAFSSNPFALAFLLVLIGCTFLLVVVLTRKGAARVLPAALDDVDLGGELVPDHGDAVMTVEVGGRIKTINERARLIFHLQEDETPNLERLARKARPPETLLKLSAAEGQARFVLEGRLVEGTSYLVNGSGPQTAVISLRYPEISSGLSGSQRGTSADTLETFTLLTQAMAASLDLDETLQAVLENVEKLVPADFMEVTIWDPPSESFIPYRFTGLPGVDRKLEKAKERYAFDQGFTGALVKERKPLLIGDIETREDLRPALEKLPIPMRAYVGLPLLVTGELIGTLELGSMQIDAFTSQDLDLLQLLSGQAGIAIHNALLFETEQRRTAELSGLARLSQAFGSVRDPGGMFASLVESIAPLLEVEIIGFLLYNESQRLLEARQPFHGLPGPIVDLYRARVLPGSTAERMLLDQDVLITEDASGDEKWSSLGMEQIAQAASLRETVLIPLAAGGHMLGYLQASNHENGPAPFSKAELHLLMIIANQTASIIENATLVQQSRLRAQRAESLRRITSLSSSSANPDEIFQFSLQELARLLRVPVAALLLLHKELGSLHLHKPSLFGISAEQAGQVAAMTVEDAQYHFTVSGSLHALSENAISHSNRPIVPYYQSMFSAWGLESVIIVPLVSRNEGVGELLLGSREADFFEQGDMQTIATAAGQLAGVAEQSFLRGQTDESLRRRVDQLTAITRISRELSTSLDLNYLLNLVYDEALRTTRADCGTILLFNLEAAAGDVPGVRFFVGDMPDAELTPLERLVVQQDAPQNVPDFAGTGFAPPHPGVHSTLIVPISYQHRTAGLISLHGKTPGKFDETAVEILQSLAVQAAVALNNALAYEEQTRRGALLRRELETLSRLIQVSRVTKPSQSLVESLEAICEAIRSATPFQAVVMSIYDPDHNVLRRTVGAGLPPEIWAELQSRAQPWTGIRKLLLPEYKVGAAYYIPHDRTPVLPAEVHTVSVLPSMAFKSEDAWHEDDMLLIPLFDAQDSPLGMISVDAPGDNRRPDLPTYEALEVFAAQAAMIIESYLRVRRLEQRVAAVSAEKARLEQSAAQAQANLPAMLHKDMEQTIALRGLHQRIERIRAGLEIAAAANRQESEEAILQTLASEMLTHFAMQVALVAERGPAGIRLTEVVGSFPPGANPEALFGQRNPLRHLLQQGGDEEERLVLVANLEGAPEWQNNTLLNALEARSIIGLPLDMGDGRTAGVLAVGQRALPAFLDEDRRVFAQLAHQVSVGLQNLQLLNQTRRRLQEVNLMLDFSRKLGSLATADILDVLVQSVAQVLPQAHCGWVGLWEEKEQAILPQAACGYASQADILAIRFQQPEPSADGKEGKPGLPLKVFRSGRAERAAELNMAAHYALSAADLLHYRKATGGRLPVSAMAVPLRMGEHVLGVMFIESFDTPDAFSAEDEALASSFTRQAAMALENARLYQASERRAAQLQALTAVAGTITSSLQRDALVSSLLEKLEEVVPYNTATLWLRAGEQLAISAAAGFSDNESRLNISAAVEDSALFKEMIQTRAPILVNDLRGDPRFTSLLAPEFLSWLGIPLIYKSEVTGLIALEKREPDFYTPDSIQAATAFASQAAVALENARLYEDSTRRASELDERSQRLALLNLLSGELVASLDLEYIFQFTSQQLRGALDADGVAAVMLDGAGNTLLQAEAPAVEGRLPRPLPPTPLFSRLLDTQGIFQTSSAAEERELRGLYEAYLRARGVSSLLVVPLTAGSVIQGWFLVYGKAAHRYGPAEIELARTMCNQTAIAVQNASLFAETRRLTSDLERRVEERTRELSREHQNSQTLLHIITELSTSLDMGLVLNRTLNVLNESTGSEESLIMLSHEAGVSPYRAGANLARLEEGRVPVERQIARWVIRSRKPALVQNVREDARWETPPESSIGYQSVIAVPLVMGEEVLGALLLFHSGEGFFSTDQLGLMEATARQIAIALNNAELFNLIRDQSEHLGSMLRDQQIEASRSRAILEAVADGVLVTNASGQVTLFNASAERILGLQTSQVMGSPLDHFSGMFGKDAIDWMQTIRDWPHSRSGSQDAETYAKRLTLENNRIVDVHLAPVFWRQEFLGTVSIFRDVTHEVQVDRLKSEFVANVSHELRTPMTSIKGYVEVMLMGAAGALSPQQERFLRIVKSNTERLGVLVNDLLDISRIEAGRVSLNFQALDVREIAEEVIGDAERRAREDARPMTFRLNARPRLPFAQGDKERVRQVLASLVSNGYNYTPDGGCVSVEIREVDQAIQVDVRDTGIGISAEVQPRIFERFFRGEDPLVLASAGTGLGLAISKTLIEMHRGQVWFESSGVRGEGSTFSFTLPVTES